MAFTAKNYLDLSGLQAYDGLIKTWANSTNQVAYKTVLKSADGNSLLFYKKENAVLGTDTPDATIALGNADTDTKLTALASIIPATYDTTNHTFAITGLTTTAKNTIVAAINELDAALDILNGADTVVGSVAKSIKDAIEGLDVTEFALTEDTNDVISIYGISESDGKIAKGSTKIDLAKVAKTGAAADVSTTAITDGAEVDPQTLYAAGDVQATLTSIARDLNSLESESVVTVEKLATAETGYIASYAVKQNGAQVGATINIPKDYLVKSATVRTVTTADEPYTGAKVGDKYIDFVVNTVEGTGSESHIYLAVNDLMSAISGGTTTVANQYELQVSVSDSNVITATLNNIYGAKVLYAPTSATTKFTNVTEVAGALNAIDTLIQGMDADVDAATPASGADANAIGVVSGITEVDGIITAVDTAYADAAGSATAAYSAIGSIQTTDINALFA